MGDISDDASLAVSELVTNAVRHGTRDRLVGARPVELLLIRWNRSLLVMVTDPSGEPPCPGVPDYDAETGRGLQLVSGLCRKWGWAPLDTRGKVVWAGFSLEDTHMEAIP